MLSTRLRVSTILGVLFVLSAAQFGLVSRLEPARADQTSPGSGTGTPAPQTAVNMLIQENIIKGNSVGLPASTNQPVSIAKYSVLLARTLDLPTTSGPASAGATQWYAQAMGTAAQYKLYPAMAANAAPTQPVNREAAAVAAIRAGTVTHVLRYEAMPRQFPPFADESSITQNARTACHQAVMWSLMSVGPDNKFEPQKPVTLGEAAQTMQQLLQDKRAAAIKE